MKAFFNRYFNDFKCDKLQLFSILALVFVISGVFGWIYEFIFYFFNSSMEKFYWRGGNFLPFINIYGTGAIMIFILAFRFRKNPFLVFLISFFSTGILEYCSGLVIYEYFGLRFWDYNTEILNFGNIGGYVCLRSVLFFGLSSLILMYGVLPFCYWLSNCMNRKAFLILSISIFSIFMFDELYNLIFSRVFCLPRAHDVYESIGFNFMDYGG